MPGKDAAAKKDKKHNLMREIRIDKLVLNCCVGKTLLLIKLTIHCLIDLLIRIL